MGVAYHEQSRVIGCDLFLNNFISTAMLQKAWFGFVTWNDL